jgi:Tol biopolymer transport system component
MYRYLLRLTLILGGAITLLITALTALPRRGVETPPSAWIVFENDHEGRSALFRSRADKQKIQWLADFPEVDGWIDYIYWSPDGQWLALNQTGNSRSNGKIYRIRPDGSQFEPLILEPSALISDWSRDGEWLLFTQNDILYRMRPDSSNQQLLFDAMPVRDPIWSPNNQWIVFTSDSSIYRIQSDGSDLRQIATETSYYSTQPWSPDGEWLVITQYDGTTARSYVVRTDGSERRPIGPENAADLRWSPDGQWISLIANLDGDDDIYRMRPDGSEFQQISNVDGEEWWARWSPDSTTLVFYSEPPSTSGNTPAWNMYGMQSDGSHLHQFSFSSRVVWSPPVAIPYRLAIPLILGGMMLLTGLTPWQRLRRRRT